MSDRKLWALIAPPFVLDALAVGAYRVSHLAACVMFCACFAYFPVVMCGGYLIHRPKAGKA